MESKPENIPISVGPENKSIFWAVFIIAVVFTIIGMWIGNPFEDYQTSSTL